MKTHWYLGLPVLTALCLLTSSAWGRTWFIKSDGTGDAPTVQAGVDSAAAGDTVFVGPGTFTDTTHVLVGGEVMAVCAHITKDLVLQGSGTSSTTLGSDAADIVVFADHVGAPGEISSFKLTTGSGGYGCVDLDKSPSVLEKHGVLCESSPVTLRDNEIYANDVAIGLSGSSAQVLDNEIHLSVRALNIEKSSDAVIRNNDIYDCAALLECIGSSPQIIDNAMHDACAGLSFQSGCSPRITGNRINPMGPDFSVGILSLSGAVIEGNWISGVYYAIKIGNEWPDTRIVRGNIIYGTAEAIQISRPNALVENNTIDVAIFGITGAAGSTFLIRNNIITRTGWGIAAVAADPPTIQCNDIFGASAAPYWGIPDQTGTNGNIAVDPEYCGIDDSGNYYLQSDSPCAPGNHPDGYECGLIGGLQVNCGKVAAEKKSWGTIKSLYRRDG